MVSLFPLRGGDGGRPPVLDLGTVPAMLGLATPFLAPATTRLSYATEERAASLHINARVDAAVAALNQLGSF